MNYDGNRGGEDLGGTGGWGGTCHMKKIYFQ